MIPIRDKSSVTMYLVNKHNNLWLTAKIQARALEDNTTKIQISEKLFHEAQDVKIKAERGI